MKLTKKSESSYYSLSYWDRLYNTFQVISDLVNDFINFNALKIILKIHKKIIKKDPGLILKQMKSICGLVHICKIREKSMQ